MADSRLIRFCRRSVCMVFHYFASFPACPPGWLLWRLDYRILNTWPTRETVSFTLGIRFKIYFKELFCFTKSLMFDVSPVSYNFDWIMYFFKSLVTSSSHGGSIACIFANFYSGLFIRISRSEKVSNRNMPISIALGNSFSKYSFW